MNKKEIQKITNHSLLSNSLNNFLIISIVIIGLNIILITYLLISESIIIRTWIVSITGLIIIWAYWWKQHEGKILIDSSTMVLLGLSLTHLLPPLYLSLRLEHSFAVDEFDVAVTYALTSLLTTIGAIAFLVGYYLVYKHPDERKNHKRLCIISIKMIKILVFFTIIIWTSRLTLLINGTYYFIHVDYSFMGSRWYSVLSQISYYGLMLPMIFWLLSSQDKRWMLWAWIFTIAEFVWVIPTGARQYIIQICLSMIIIKWRHLRKVPWLQILLIIMVFFIAFPILGQARYAVIKFSDINEVNLRISTYYLKEAAKLAQESGDILTNIDYTISRIYDGQFFGFLLKNYLNEYKLEYGKTYLDRIPFIFMPYFINPDRPIMQLPLGHWYQQLIAGGSQPTTYLGEAYINFGYLGIPVMAFVLGVILGVFENLFHKLSEHAYFTAAYLLFLVTFIYKVTAPLSVWLADMRNIAIFTIILYAIHRFYDKQIIKT